MAPIKWKGVTQEEHDGANALKNAINAEPTKLSIKLFIYESGPNHEEMEDVLCT
ncbi:MAG TPA: hypothetical protein VE843_11040 [Ktedonobacteraceae bacterium]|jgi:hypothetical protein|nr:hypothetical protein [Ktedonobacteraceae bacterium]